MRVHHRLDEPDPLRETPREELREARQHAGEEEDGRRSLCGETEAAIEPEHEQRLHDEPAAEGVEAEEGSQAEHDRTRTSERPRAPTRTLFRERGKAPVEP